MCDGHAATGCDVMNLAQFETTLKPILKDRLTKLDDQCSAIYDVIAKKKKAFVEMYLKNPKISHHEAVSLLKKANESFDPFNPGKEKEKTQLAEKCIGRAKNKISKPQKSTPPVPQPPPPSSGLRQNVKMKLPDLAKYRRGMEKVNPNFKNEKPVALVETSSRRKDQLQVLQETSTRLPNFDDLPNFEMYHRNQFKIGNDFIFVSKKIE